jgi:hypothetical protein
VAQWKTSDFYKWCRAQGVYLNVPDHYFLVGSTKTAMGYRETNWSLPRAQQIIHGRQNIFDGTWEKTPSMGWMFVPLTEYHGGGEAATIEPLSEHLAHYEARLAHLFGRGQACCGPRLCDTDETRGSSASGWTSTRPPGDPRRRRRPPASAGRATGQPPPRRPAPAHTRPGVIRPSTRTSAGHPAALYYTGLTRPRSCAAGGPRAGSLDRDHSVTARVKLPARGRTFLTIEAP